MTWDVVKKIADGTPVLLQHPVYKEIYEAHYNRWAVHEALHPRGITAPFQVSDPSLLLSVPHETLQQRFAALHVQNSLPDPGQLNFAKESDEGDMLGNWTYFKRYTAGAAGSSGGYEYLNIFTEAGLGRTDFVDLPHLLSKEFYKDFYGPLNLMTFLWVDEGAPQTSPDYEHAECFGGAGVEWAPVRAHAWSDIPQPYVGSSTSRIGRRGTGEYNDGLDKYYAEVWNYPEQTWTADLSCLAGIKDVDGNDLDCTRIVVCLIMRPKDWAVEVNATFATIPYKLQISPDGAAWTTIKTGVILNPGGTYPLTLIKAVSTNPAHWKAATEFRIVADIDENADTPGWGTPNGGNTYYFQVAEIAGYLVVFATFDWRYKTA